MCCGSCYYSGNKCIIIVAVDNKDFIIFFKLNKYYPSSVILICFIKGKWYGVHYRCGSGECCEYWVAMLQMY